jgi:hypothetical protein
MLRYATLCSAALCALWLAPAVGSAQDSMVRRLGIPLPAEAEPDAPDELNGYYGDVPTTLTSFWTGSSLNYCVTWPSPTKQANDMEFRRANTKTGLCFQCTTTQEWPARSFVASTDQVTELDANFSCRRIQDQQCLPPIDTAGIPPYCSYPQDQTRPWDPGYSPKPKPGPNGERVCNTDCRSSQSYSECVGGFKVCHTFSDCSDDTLEICNPGPCSDSFFCN